MGARGLVGARRGLLRGRRGDLGHRTAQVPLFVACRAHLRFRLGRAALYRGHAYDNLQCLRLGGRDGASARLTVFSAPGYGSKVMVISKNLRTVVRSGKIQGFLNLAFFFSSPSEAMRMH